MYRNDTKDVRELVKRCTGIHNTILTLLKTGTDETKKRSLGKHFYATTQLISNK